MSDPVLDIPDDWDVTTLGEVNTLKSRTLLPGAFPDEQFEYYSIPDYQNGEKPGRVKGKTIASAKLQLKPKSVLFGKLNPRVEKVWRVGPLNDLRQIGSTEWIPVLPDERMDPDFLYFLEWSDHVMPKAKKLVNGSTPSRQRVDPSSFYKIQIPLPSLPEQRSIAHVLSTVQEAIAQQERLIRTTTELKQALMQILFTEGLRSEALKETEIGMVPESWVKVELGALGRVVTGTTPSTTVKEYYEPAEVDFIAPADIGKSRLVRDAQKKISAAGFAVARPLPKDAVMCVCIGATIGKVGMTAQAQSATNQQINTIICGENYDPRFVHYLLTQHAEYWRSFATFGPVPMLSKGAFEKIIIHVPSNKLDQTDSADALVALDDKIEVAQKKRNALQDLFRTLLHELMTGKVRVGEKLDSVFTNA